MAKKSADKFKTNDVYKSPLFPWMIGIRNLWRNVKDGIIVLVGYDLIDINGNAQSGADHPAELTAEMTKRQYEYIGTVQTGDDEDE